jgi:GTP cyclohydrolase I
MQSPQERIVEQMLEFIGEEPSRDGLRDTPRRVVKSWGELFKGYSMDVKSVFTVFDESHDEMVVLRNIEFFSTCEHHMLPFFGKAHVGYLPDGKIVGISKLARLVEVFSRRLQVQERLGWQVSSSIMQELMPKGCGVVLEAQHLCMVARGVNKQNSVMVTSAMQGVFRSDPAIRAEFLSAIGR